MKDPTEVTKRIEARPIEGTFGETSIRSELMDCESWPMVMSLSCVWVPVHGCQTEAAVGLFLHKLYMSVSEAWRLSCAEREAEFARARKRAYGDCGRAPSRHGNKTTYTFPLKSFNAIVKKSRQGCL